MKDLCVIFFGQTQMKRLDGVYLLVVLDTLLDKTLQNSSFNEMD